MNDKAIVFTDTRGRVVRIPSTWLIQLEPMIEGHSTTVVYAMPPGYDELYSWTVGTVTYAKIARRLSGGVII